MQDVLRFIHSAFILSGILFWSKLHWRRNISKLHGLFVMRRPGLCRAPAMSNGFYSSFYCGLRYSNDFRELGHP